MLWPGHQPLPGDGPVVALRGVQSFFYSSIQVLSGDEGFCFLLSGERRPAEREPPAHATLPTQPAGLQPTAREAPALPWEGCLQPRSSLSALLTF